jgi:hypothetical protein
LTLLFAKRKVACVAAECGQESQAKWDSNMFVQFFQKKFHAFAIKWPIFSNFFLMFVVLLLAFSFCILFCGLFFHALSW